MMRKISMIAAFAAMGWATTAYAAEEHVILILPDAFFPEITYVKPGDTVRFVNLQANEATIVGTENAWEIGPLGVQGEEVMSISGSMVPDFHEAIAETDTVETTSDSVEGESTAIAFKGSFSFDPAPLR